LKKFLLFALFVVLPSVASAEDPLLDRPHWSFELKGGNFAPAVPDWEQSYGKRDIPVYALSLAYKVIRQIEIGIEGAQMKAKGLASGPLHSAQAGHPVFTGTVNYEILPVNIFVLFRGVVNENQWVVPYAGGGFTKILYREDVEGQDSVSGSANGYHARGGLQFLLDGIDRGAANSMYMDYGVDHTYFFIEAEYTSAKVNSVELGGTAYLAGLLLEF